MHRVYLPFDIPAFKNLNSNHPLPGSLVEAGYDGIEFVRSIPGESKELSATKVFQQAALFAEQINSGHANLPRSQYQEALFVATRDLASQSYYDASADLAFLHTAPMMINQMPYVLHFEALTMLFYPYWDHGRTKDITLRNEQVFWYVRTMLESPNCRGIFSNLACSIEHLEKAFASEIIARKARYIRPGPNFTPQQAAKIAARIERREPKKEVEILFTNSWHQHELSFFLRGGFDVVLAFLEIEKEYPDLRLTLRTKLPGVLGSIQPDFRKIIPNHPKITWLPDMVSEDEIIDIFTRADIFCLHSCGVHSLSVLRAMYCGSVCIVSDIPGYDEYVTHSETGIMLPGLRSEIISEEKETGWMRDDFGPMYAHNRWRVDQLIQTFKFLCDNPDLRVSLGRSAREQVLKHNSFSQWRDGFEGLLRNALEQPPKSDEMDVVRARAGGVVGDLAHF